METLNIANSNCNCTLPEDVTEWPVIMRDGRMSRDNPITYKVDYYLAGFERKIGKDYATLDEAIAAVDAAKLFGEELNYGDFRKIAWGICGSDYAADVCGAEDTHVVIRHVVTPCPVHIK